MNDREVVVTGVGLVTPLGTGVEQNWEKLKKRATGISPQRQDAVPNWLAYCGKVSDFELPSVPGSNAAQFKFLNRGARLGFAAAHQAMEQTLAGAQSVPVGRRALYVASGDFSKIGYEFFYPATREEATGKTRVRDWAQFNQNALTQVTPFFLLESIANNLFSFLSACYDFKGANTSLASLSPYGSQALDLAYRAIQSGAADVALAVGYGNWIDEIPVCELEGLGLLSRCDRAAESFRPFDRLRDGFIPAEGGAAVFLEAEELAKQRGRMVLAKIRGSGNCIEFSDGGGFSVPPRVTERSMRMALAASRCEVEELGFIIGHGSGTLKGDRSELRSLQALTASTTARIPVCALKAYTGHMGAASDITEIVLGIQAARDGMAPATLNFAEAEKEFSRLALAATHQPCTGDCFLSVSYGLGGQSSAVVVSVDRSFLAR